MASNLALATTLTLDVKNFMTGLSQASGLLNAFAKNLSNLSGNNATNLSKVAASLTALNATLQNTQGSQAAVSQLQQNFTALQNTLNGFSTASVQKIQAITQALQGMNQALKGVTSAGTAQAAQSLGGLAQAANTAHGATTNMHGGWKNYQTSLYTWASTRGWRESFHELHGMLDKAGERAKEAVHEFVAFEDNALRAAAVFGAGGEDFTATAAKIYEASKGALGNSKFGMEALSESFVELATAGFNSTAAISALPVVTNLAQAGMMKLGQTTEIVTAGQHEWGFTNERLPIIADAMTKAFSYSANTLSSLQQSYKYAGAAAKASGESFSEFNALLGVLANVGFKGSNAGTALRSTFINLQTQTGAAGEALKRYNVQVYDAQGKLRPMIDLLEELNDKTHHDVGQISLITGKYASSGITSLMGQLKREGEESNNALRIMQARLQGLNETSAINLVKNLTEIKNGTNTASEGAKELQRLGVSAFNEMSDKAGNSIKNLKSLQQLALEITSKGGGASSLVKLGVNEQDANNIINTINKVKAANKNLFSQSGAEAFTEQMKLVDEEMLRIGNATEMIAKRNESGLGGALRLLKNNLQAIGIAVVRDVQPGLNALLAGSPNSEGIRQLGGLVKILKDNEQAIVSLLSGAANLVVTLAGWGVQLIGLAVNHKEVAITLGLLYIGSILLKNQVFELAAAYMGQWVVALMQSGTVTKAAIVQNAALGASQAGLLTGIKSSATALMAWVASSATAIGSFSLLGAGSTVLTAALGTVTLAFKGLMMLFTAVAPIAVFGAALYSVVTLFGLWREGSQQVADQERTLSDAIQRSNSALEARKGIDVSNLNKNNIQELRTAKDSLIQSISALEQVQATINASAGDKLFSDSKESSFAKVKPEDFANLQKYKQELAAVNQELKKDTRVAQGTEYDKLAAMAEHYHKVIEHNTERRKGIAKEEAAAVIQAEEHVASTKMSYYDKTLARAQQSAKEAYAVEQELANKIIELTRSIALEKMSDEDKIREIKRRGMSEQAQEADKTKQVVEKVAQAKELAAKGDEESSKLAVKAAEDAKNLASSLKDGGAAVKLYTEAAEVKLSVQEKEIESTKKLQEEVQKLAKETPTVKVDSDIQEAESKLEEIKKKMQELDGKTSTVKVNVQQNGNVGANSGGFIGAIMGRSHFADGGAVPGTGDSDTVPAMLTPQEFVVTARDNRSKMAGGFLNFVNFAPIGDVRAFLQQLQVPQFNTGGWVAPISLPSLPQLRSDAGGRDADRRDRGGDQPVPTVRFEWTLGQQSGSLMAEADGVGVFVSALHELKRGAL